MTRSSYVPSEVLANIQIDRLSERIADKDWPSLNLPTPEQILATLRTGAAVEFPAMKLELVNGQVWYSDARGNTELLEAKELIADLESLLTCVARGGE